MDKQTVVAGVSKQVVWWVAQRRRKLAALSHDSMAVNPFLLPLLMGLGNLSTLQELVSFLLAGHFCTGHATGFGKLVDEKILPNVFHTTKLNKAFRKLRPYNLSMFDEIDHLFKRPNGDVFLLCQKAGRWTIQLTMAVQLNKAFNELVKAKHAGTIAFKHIMVGVFYGTTDGLTDKYDILRGINRGANHDVIDLRQDVQVVAGKEFWKWLNDDEPNTQEWVLEGVLDGYQKAIDQDGSLATLISNFHTSFEEQYQQHLLPNGAINWKGILTKLNG